MKQAQEWYYMVWNTKENRPEHSNGQSGRYYNMYTAMKPARTLRTRRYNYLYNMYEPTIYNKDVNDTIAAQKAEIKKLNAGIIEYGYWVKDEYKNPEKDIAEKLKRRNKQLKEAEALIPRTDKWLIAKYRIFEVWRINFENGKKELCIDVDGNILIND